MSMNKICHTKLSIDPEETFNVTFKKNREVKLQAEIQATVVHFETCTKVTIYSNSITANKAIIEPGAIIKYNGKTHTNQSNDNKVFQLNGSNLLDVLFSDNQNEDSTNDDSDLIGNTQNDDTEAI